MDPIAIVIITLLVLAFGGSTATTLYQSRNEALRKALHEKRYVTGGNMLSLFDVFWDLGASDYALEMMGQQGLLPTTTRELPQSYQNLDELIEQHGSYHEYIEETLAAIETYYREHRRLGTNRRNTQTLQLQHEKKLLPLQRLLHPSERHERPASTALTRRPAPETQNSPAPFSFQSMILDFSLADRQSFRQEKGLLPGSLVLSYDPLGQTDFDLDQITGLDVTGILTMLFDGALTTGLQKWWKMRRLRTLKITLDQHLTALYELFATQASKNSNFFSALFHSADQWKREAARLQRILESRPAAGQRWELPATLLLTDACALAENLARQAYSATSDCLETIRNHGLNNNKPMAGYLIFLNQHAFFAGRVPNYAHYTNQVEIAAYHIREELNKLHRQGVI